MRIRHMIFATLMLAVTAVAAVAPAAARPLEPERQAKLVGDQADGYLGIVGAASPALRQQVDAINAERRSVYTKMAAEKGVPVTAVEAIFGEQLFQQTPSGQYFRDSTGVWKIKP